MPIWTRLCELEIELLRHFPIFWSCKRHSEIKDITAFFRLFRQREARTRIVFLLKPSTIKSLTVTTWPACNVLRIILQIYILKNYIIFSMIYWRVLSFMKNPSIVGFRRLRLLLINEAVAMRIGDILYLEKEESCEGTGEPARWK